MKPLTQVLYCRSLILFAFVAILTISSCKKNDQSATTAVSGSVVDATTNKGIPNAIVILLRKKNDVISTGNPAPYATYKADGNGNFHFEFTQESGYGYYVSPSMPVAQYWEAPQPTSINEGKDNNVSLKLDSKGYIKIHFKSTNSNIIEVGTYFNKWGSAEFYGVIDTTIVDYTYGNKKNYYNAGIRYKDNTTRNQIDTIYCPPFDTIYHEFILN